MNWMSSYVLVPSYSNLDLEVEGLYSNHDVGGLVSNHDLKAGCLYSDLDLEVAKFVVFEYIPMLRSHFRDTKWQILCLMIFVSR